MGVYYVYVLFVRVVMACLVVRVPVAQKAHQVNQAAVWV